MPGEMNGDIQVGTVKYDYLRLLFRCSPWVEKKEISAATGRNL